tara:strand:- start:18755 stop:19006 length:252 start_codon:yes stop_codon:yes gene_type:complete
MELVLEIWSSLRPYLVLMIRDAIVCALLWMFLWLFKMLTNVIEIGGWAGEWIANIHSLGAILAFSAFGVLFIVDVIKLHKEGH